MWKGGAKVADRRRQWPVTQKRAFTPDCRQRASVRQAEREQEAAEYFNENMATLEANFKAYKENILRHEASEVDVATPEQPFYATHAHDYDELASVASAAPTIRLHVGPVDPANMAEA